MLPLLVQPAQPEDNNDAFAFINAAMGPDEPSPFMSLLGTLQQSMQDIQNRPGPQMMDVPAQANPYASFLATVGANLAERLGQEGAAGGMQQRIAGVAQQRQDVQDYNRQLTEQDRQQRIKESMALQSQLIDAELEQAKQMGDMTKLRKELAARLAMDKEMQRLEDIDKEKERVNRLQVAGISASSRPQATDVESGKIQTALTTANNGIEAILGDPQSYVSIVPSLLQGMNPLVAKIKGTQLKPEAAKRAQDYALSIAQGSPYPEVRQAMLFRYAETLRKNGILSKDDPAVRAFLSQVNTLLPPEEQLVFLQSLGLK